jgi:glycosyltransferase involved in cell wall biosynthesis
MKIAVLWNTLTGYMGAALRAVAAQPGTSLFVADQSSAKQAPFDDRLFDWIPERYRYPRLPRAAELIPRLEAFSPDVLVITSWDKAGYRRVCRHFEGRAVRVCAMDNPWEGTGRQWLGALSSPLFVQRLFDAAFVTGERQAEFARRLGFAQDRIWRGVYTPDYDYFHQAAAMRAAAPPRSFLFAGRLVADKGISTLAEAYRRYSAGAGASPWPLHVVGGGPLAAELENIPGVVMHGFLQPDEILPRFAEAGCFLLPSLSEHWGVVIQEAAVAGLPIISSWQVGASVHYVADGYNGCLVDAGNAAQLAGAMCRISRLSDERLQEMSLASRTLGEQIRPEHWARNVLERGGDLKREILARKAARRNLRPGGR